MLVLLNYCLAKESNILNQNNLDFNNFKEIDSVSSFISEVKALREAEDGTSTELYFRGQEVEFWDIEPSIFRNNMLSIEHTLMQIPLQKIPMEFKEFNTMFDIMTKYQHYGMCTRLLDLTTNPLVALYFACKIHGKEKYEIESEQIEKEPDGVIYYTNSFYPSKPLDKEVEIVSALASYDLTKENTIIEIFEKLRQSQIIDKETEERWLQNEFFNEFVKIIQNNYMVIPTYTNERLRKQSGVFLLASMFSIFPGAEIKKSVIIKSKRNLRSEFSEKIFYIRGENKSSILKELDLYNINEATLFPELEHQLNHIRHINKECVQTVSEFFEYDTTCASDKQSLDVDDTKLDDYLLCNLSDILKSEVEDEDIIEIQKIIQNNASVDWYKRDNVISKIKMAITGYYFLKYSDKSKSKEKANIILNLLSETVQKFTTNNEVGE
ncbi:MAG: FRG domain-containing protein [Ruminococcus sp.]|nr:FRG domain-containing protein [Ruminococcus sp.]